MFGLLAELDSAAFQRIVELSRRVDEPDPPDPKTAAFISAYARFCASLYVNGFVPEVKDARGYMAEAVKALSAPLDSVSKVSGSSGRGSRRAQAKGRKP